MVYKGKSIYKWMIWGYPHLWKPPYIKMEKKPGQRRFVRKRTVESVKSFHKNSQGLNSETFSVHFSHMKSSALKTSPKSEKRREILNPHPWAGELRSPLKSSQRNVKFLSRSKLNNCLLGSPQLMAMKKPWKTDIFLLSHSHSGFC